MFALPDIPFCGITLTMPNQFWPILKENPHIRQQLPSIAASAIDAWAWNKFQVRLFSISILHTFGRRFNHHPHVHMMVSAGGFRPYKADWVPDINFDKFELMDHWRQAVTALLWKAKERGMLKGSSIPEDLSTLIFEQLGRCWNIHISPKMSKKHFLLYAGRYVRRPPIAQNRILSVSPEKIVYSKQKGRWAPEEIVCTPAEFLNLWRSHIGERYRHSMRYFGLMSPRMKHLYLPVVHSILGEEPRSKRRPLDCATLVKKSFGTDRFVDSIGNRLHRVGRLKPNSKLG